MGEATKEKVKNKADTAGKKYKSKVIRVIMRGTQKAAGRFFGAIRNNTKRLGSLVTITLFFVVCNSFTFPRFLETTQVGIETETMGIIDQQAIHSVLAHDGAFELTDEEALDGYEDVGLEGLDVNCYTLDEILDENGQAYLEDGKGKQFSGQETEIKLDKNDWRLVLINKQHPVPEDYEFTLGTIKDEMKCDERIIEDLLLMLQGAKNDGINLVICSPYRDMNRQEYLFEKKIKLYMQNGLSYMEAYCATSQAVTVPGASEHQIGLALDIVCNSYYYLNEGFGETEAGKWLAEHSCEYGFILRYPQGKEYITGIEYEPWHFRYVGREAATIIMSQGITLEEFVETLE